MRRFSSIRLALARCCFGLGLIWVAAGVLKLIFGIRIGFPLLPPLGLQRVEPVPAISVGLLLIFVGAWVERVTVGRQGCSETLARDELKPQLTTPRPEPRARVVDEAASPIYRSPLP